MTSTLDAVSNGRLELGLGIGWDAEEHNAYGMKFGSHSERCDRLKEAVQIIKMLWTEERSNFEGRFCNLNKAYCAPKPVQKPHPPIMIGGSSNRILQLVAQHADSCHMFLSHDKYSGKISILEEFCRKIGRDYSKITKTVGTSIANLADQNHALRGKIAVSREKDDTAVHSDKSVESSVRNIRNWIMIGVTRFSIDFPEMPRTSALAWFADQIIPQFKSID